MLRAEPRRLGRARCTGLAGLCLALLSLAPADLAPVQAAIRPGASNTPATSFDPLVRASRSNVHADLSVLLGISRAGDRLVAVGERGAILLSDNQGEQWRQALAPVSVSLTAVHFVDARQGWAVGHGQVILHSQDGGLSWQRQLDGVQAAHIELEAAKAQAATDPRALKNAERLVSEGADKPFLDVHFFDTQHGLVVGAYGAIFATDDGGQTWRSRRADLNNPQGHHLYRIHLSGHAVFICGEQGALYRAPDEGAAFAEIKTPYAGSLFGVLTPADDNWVVYGLRGHVLRSTDSGATWQAVSMPDAVTLTSGAVLTDGSLLLADEAGKVLRSTDGAQSFVRVPTGSTASFTHMAQAADGMVVLTSARGTLRLKTAQTPSRPQNP